MKIERNNPKRKVLTNSAIISAATLLGLYLNNGTVVKADSLAIGPESDQISRNVNTGTSNSTNQSENSTSENETASIAQTSTTSDSIPANNQSETSSTGNGTTQTGINTAPTDKEANKADFTDSVKTYTWNGQNVTFDSATKKLSITGGTDASPVELTNPDALRTIVDPAKIGEIIITGKIKIKGSADYLFGDLINLTKITGLDQLDISEATDMQGMFQNCYMLQTLDLSHFDTSNATNMSNFFWHCYSLKNLNLSGFKTAKVTDMSHMFVYCENLTSLDLSDFNTANVENMRAMFLGCSGLTNLDVSNFDTAKVTNMSSMFQECQSLTSLDLTSFITANVENMSWMFSFCWQLANIDLNKFDTSKVTDMMAMFRECSSLTSLDLTKFNTTNVTNMWYMFDSCVALTELDLSSFNTSKVHSMGRMFNSCKNLSKLNISSFDMSNLDGNVDIDGFDDYDIDPDDAAYITEGMLRGLPKLKILVLGPNCNLKKTDFDKEGEYTVDGEEIPAVDPESKWVSLAGGTLTNAKGKNVWTPEEMIANYNGATDHDTYIRSGVVKLHYQDTKGKKINEDQVVRGLIGAVFDTSDKVGKKEILGYAFKKVLGDNVYKETSNDVTYIYTKTISEVVVHYQDESGHQIAPDETLSGKIGDAYQSTKKSVTGYTFKDVNGQASGVYEEEPKEVTYIYTKIIDSPGNPIMPAVISKVTVHYLDENGNRIDSDEVLTGRVGDRYQSIQKTVPGYTFKEVRGNASGHFAADEETVTYFYTKDGKATATKLPNHVSKPTKSNQKKSKKKKINSSHSRTARQSTLHKLEQLLIRLVKILVE